MHTCILRTENYFPVILILNISGLADTEIIIFLAYQQNATSLSIRKTQTFPCRLKGNILNITKDIFII